MVRCLFFDFLSLSQHSYQEWLRRNRMDVPGSDDREETGTKLGHNKGKKGVKNMTSNGITVNIDFHWETGPS